jgi:hypothetical protein
LQWDLLQPVGYKCTVGISRLQQSAEPELIGGGTVPARDQWTWLLRPGPDDTNAFTAQHLDAALGLVVEAVAGASACSITELAGGTYRTSAASSQQALDLDLAQYRSGDGPCMTAARDRQQQQVRDMRASTRFTEFADAAVKVDVHSSLSIPIRTTYNPAALNIYACDVDAFDDHDRAVAELLGRAFTARMLGASGTRALSISETVQVTTRRKLIRAAQDATGGVGEDAGAAFAALAERSARERRSIFDLAREVTGQPADLQ